MTTTTLTLAQLIDETLDQLYYEIEKPRPLLLGAAIDASQTTLTVASNAEVATITDLLEAGSELMLITAKTDDANPTFTVLRGYSRTDAVAHAKNDVVLVNPYWTRSAVTRALQRFFTGAAPVWLPLIRAEMMNTVEYAGVGQQLIPLDSDVIRVLEVRYQSPTSGRVVNLPGWRFEDNLPSAVVSSGMGLRVPSTVSPSDDLLVSMSVRYAWSGSGEDATVDVPAGCEDIPALYAAAVLASGREVSRLELDRLTEQSSEQAARTGSNVGLIRLKWQEVYRRLDEARRTISVPRPLVYRRFQRGA